MTANKDPKVESPAQAPAPTPTKPTVAWVFNKTPVQAPVPVINSQTKERDFIFLQGNSRAKIPPGYLVDPEFLALRRLDFEQRNV